MAKRTFQYGSYQLGWLLEEACAVWYENGQRKRHRLGAFKTQGVQACQAALIAFAEAEQRHQLSTDTTVEKVFEAYKDYLTEEGKQVLPCVTVWKHLRHTFANLAPSAVTDAICRQYARTREKQGASVGTIWTELNRLSCALCWASKKAFIQEKFGYKGVGGRVVWQPKKPEPRDRVLTADEVVRLVEAAKSPHVSLFILVTVMGGGARSGAVLELTWNRVDIDTGVIDFRIKRENVSVLDRSHKKARAIVPMTDTLRGVLHHHKTIALTDHVIEFRGSRVRSIRTGFEAACRDAGIEDCSPHVLRHTVATWLRNGQEGFDNIARVIGHKDAKTTQKHYIHASVEGLRGTVDKLDVFKQRGLKIVGGKG